MKGKFNIDSNISKDDFLDFISKKPVVLSEEFSAYKMTRIIWENTSDPENLIIERDTTMPINLWWIEVKVVEQKVGISIEGIVRTGVLMRLGIIIPILTAVFGIADCWKHPDNWLSYAVVVVFTSCIYYIIYSMLYRGIPRKLKKAIQSNIDEL